jgi:hypothetical protein
MTLRSSTTLTPPTMCDDPYRQLRPLPHLRPRPSFVRFGVQYCAHAPCTQAAMCCACTTVAAHATQHAACVQHYRFAGGPVPQRQYGLPAGRVEREADGAKVGGLRGKIRLHGECHTVRRRDATRRTRCRTNGRQLQARAAGRPAVAQLLHAGLLRRYSPAVLLEP